MKILLLVTLLFTDKLFREIFFACFDMKHINETTVLHTYIEDGKMQIEKEYIK